MFSVKIEFEFRWPGFFIRLRVKKIYEPKFKWNLFQIEIGTINELLENDSIIYIIPRKDHTKYIKYIKDEEEEDFIENMIYLFNNLRVLAFVWPSPMESNQKFNLKIGCKDMYNSNFVANFNNIANDEDGSGQYKSTNYVKTFICPDDEYTLMVEHKVKKCLKILAVV